MSGTVGRTSPPSPFGRAALAYAERPGWAVFALSARSKIPAIPKAHGGGDSLAALAGTPRILTTLRRGTQPLLAEGRRLRWVAASEES